MLDSEFSRVTVNGQPMWLHRSGRLLPVVAGGSDDGGTPPEGGGGDDDGKPKVITMTPEQLSQRLARAKPADYDELKAKAEQFDELQASQKSEIEKALEKATAAEQRAAAAAAEALRWKVAAKHGISDEDAELFLTGTDEETLTRQAERLAARASDRKRTGNVVPKEGSTTEAKDDQLRDFTRRLFGKAD